MFLLRAVASWLSSELFIILLSATLTLDIHSNVTLPSFWKSFQSHGNDWPLALCDYRSINYVADCRVADRVYHDRFTENQHLHFNPGHKWFYVKDLRPDEVVVFRQLDSQLEGGGGEFSLLCVASRQDFMLTTVGKALHMLDFKTVRSMPMLYQDRV